jgi:hypothetical protein
MQSCHPDSAFNSVQAELLTVKVELQQLAGVLDELNIEIKEARARRGDEKELDWLRSKELKLHDKELKLRDKELFLLQQQAKPPSQPPAPDILLALGKLGLFDPERVSSSSRSSMSATQKKLRCASLRAYGLSETSACLQCPILLLPLPARVVTCAHLVPRALRSEWPQIGVAVGGDDDTRNVMFMFKCLEEAFDEFLLSFIAVQGGDSDSTAERYRVHVWDPVLRKQPIAINVRNREVMQKFSGITLPESLDALTFGDVHDKERILASPNGHTPYRRALLLQAVLAREKARHRGWEDVELPELSGGISPDISPEKVARILQWRDAAFAAAPKEIESQNAAAS